MKCQNCGAPFSGARTVVAIYEFFVLLALITPITHTHPRVRLLFVIVLSCFSAVPLHAATFVSGSGQLTRLRRVLFRRHNSFHGERTRARARGRKTVLGRSFMCKTVAVAAPRSEC